MKTNLISFLLVIGILFSFAIALKIILVVYSLKFFALLVLFGILVCAYGSYRFKRGLEKAADFTAEIIKHKK